MPAGFLGAGISSDSDSSEDSSSSMVLEGAAFLAGTGAAFGFSTGFLTTAAGFFVSTAGVESLSSSEDSSSSIFLAGTAFLAGLGQQGLAS